MIALSMITNDAERTIAILEKYGQYFDKWFITVADKDTKQVAKFKKDKYPKLELSYFKWEDNFGKAREFNRQQIDTDYFFWMDSDDEISNPSAIPGLVKIMESDDLDAIYMRYDYQKNDLGESTGDHWRERIVRTKHFKWAESRVHETLLAPSAQTKRTDLVTILHNKTAEEEMKSLERNIRLLKLDFDETQDPRTAMYLGDNLTVLKKYDEAISYLTFHLQNSGWDEDKYRCWLKVGEILYLQSNYAEALQATVAAEELLPDWPDAFFLRASIYKELNKPKNVYENVKTGMLKGKKDTLSVINPTLYEYKALFLGALAAIELGKVEEAYKMMTIVLQKSPDYKPAKDIYPIFQEAMEDTNAIEHVKWLIYYLKDRGGNPQKLMESLPMRVLSDSRLNAHRVKVFPPKKWPEKSIVFYCGKSTEAWGPDTLDKGMGGSEEAVVYLSRELAKLGWQVTVFNDREDEYQDGGWTQTGEMMGGEYHDYSSKPVFYKPWTLFNPFDEFDAFIAWRNPQGTRGIKARVKGVDLHDTPIGHQAVGDTDVENTDLYFFKSEYQTKYAPNIPREKMVVVGNGIVRSQFDGKNL